MNTPHLSDMEIQQYADGNTEMPTHIQAHMNDCGECRAAAAFYHQLFTGLAGQPAASFDFDLAALVTSRLPVTKPIPVWTIIISSILVSVGIPLFLFRTYIMKAYPGILTASVYLFLVPTVAVIVLQVLEMLRRHQKQMNALNFS